MIAFDFSLNCDPAIKDFSALAMNNIPENEENPARIDITLLDKAFVQKFAYTSDLNNGVDSEIKLTLPLESAYQFLESYSEAFEGPNRFPFEMHLLRKYVVIKLCFNS
jgi:hypothetical protein